MSMGSYTKQSQRVELTMYPRPFFSCARAASPRRPERISYGMLLRSCFGDLVIELGFLDRLSGGGECAEG